VKEAAVPFVLRVVGESVLGIFGFRSAGRGFEFDGDGCVVEQRPPRFDNGQ
jgi:hypothetical protein